MRTRVAIAIILACVTWSGAAAAQDGTIATKPKASAPADGEDEKKVLHYDAIVEQWAARQRSLLPRKTGSFRRDNALLAKILAEHGIHGQASGAQAFDLAHAAIANSVEIEAADDMEGALAEAELATQLAPDLPSAHARLAEVRFGARDFPGVIDALKTWGASIARNPWVRTAYLARAVVAVMVGLILALLLVGVVYLVRSFRLVAFDVHNALPRGAARWQVQLVLLTVTLLPLGLATGPLITALAWLALSFLYLSRRERIVTLLLVATTAGLPFAVDYGARLWSWQGSAAHDEHRALYDVGAVPVRDALRAAPERSPRADAALALADLRKGELKEANERWRALAKADPDTWWIQGNLGASTALVGEEDKAIAALKLAMRDTRAIAAAFNAAELYYRQGKTTEGEKATAFVSANGSNVDLDQFRAITYRSSPEEVVSHNRSLVLSPVPPAPLVDVLAASPAATRIEREVAQVLYFGLQREVAAGIFGAVFLLLLALLKVSSRVQPSRPCGRCGAPASERYDGAEVPRDTCSACFHAFLSPSTTIEAGMKVRKERQVVSYQRRQRRLRRWLSLPIPGLGHLYSGAVVRGAIFADLALGVAAIGFAFLGPIPWPELEGWQDRGIFIGVAVGLYALLALLAFWRAGSIEKEG
jgi:tetratricopeptide (TPR) repeat protein